MNDSNMQFVVNIKMIEAALYSMNLIFKEGFKSSSALIVRMGINDENEFTVTLLFPLVQRQNESDNSNEPDLFDIKLDFIKNVIGMAMQLDHISFQTKKNNENILFLFSLTENTHE